MGTFGQALVISPMASMESEDIVWADSPMADEGTLHWLQRVAGTSTTTAFVDCVTMSSDQTGLPGAVDVWYDDEALMGPAPQPNLSAAFLTGRPLVGRVIICPTHPDGETQGWPEVLVPALCDYFQSHAVACRQALEDLFDELHDEDEVDE